MPGTQQGDAQVVSTAPPAGSVQDAASTKLSQESNQIGMTGILGGAERIAVTTGEGIAHTPEGIIDTAENYIQHPMNLVKAVGESAAIGAGLKLLLPETGPVGTIAGLAIGGMFMAQAAPGFIDAYKTGLNANTWSEMGQAGQQWGDSMGSLAVNLPLGYAGFKLGAGAASYAMGSEAMDGFMAAKGNFWNSVETKFPSFASTVGIADTSPQARLAPRVADGKAEFLGSEKAAPEDPKAAQPLDPNSKMSVTVKVARQNQGQFDRLVERIKNGRSQPISRAEFESKYSADPDAVASVKKFAADNGLTVEDENPNARSIKLGGTVGQMQNVFGAKLDNYESPTDGVYRARAGTYSVPEELSGKVQSVLNLDQRATVRPQFVLADNSQAGAVASDHASVADGGGKGGGKGPTPKTQAPMPADVILKSYGADPATYTNKGGHTAFLSFGGTIDDAVPAYLKAKGVDPSTLNVIDKASSPPTADPQGANVENGLDAVTQKLGMREGNVDMISLDNSNDGFVGGIDYVNHPTTSVEYQGSSTSWGGPDKQAWDAQGRQALDESLKDGIALGKTHTFSSGDDGASDGGSLKVQTDYPASSGNAIAVGGTTETISAKGVRGTETAWSKNGATGGGVSAVEPRPTYQNFITGIKNLGGTFKGRIVPDIAMDAAPSTPVEVPTDAQGNIGVGGTSFSNPLFQATVRELSEASGKPIGFINTMLYKWGQDPVIAKKVFNDITVGDNALGKTGYSAGPGYDAVTGWGSPNFQGMLDELNNPTSKIVSGARSSAYAAYYNGVNLASSIARQPSQLVHLIKGANAQTTDRPGA